MHLEKITREKYLFTTVSSDSMSLSLCKLYSESVAQKITDSIELIFLTTSHRIQLDSDVINHK